MKKYLEMATTSRQELKNDVFETKEASFTLVRPPGSLSTQDGALSLLSLRGRGLNSSFHNIYFIYIYMGVVNINPPRMW